MLKKLQQKLGQELLSSKCPKMILRLVGFTIVPSLADDAPMLATRVTRIVGTEVDMPYQPRTQAVEGLE